jgi:hypothetical protein
MIFRSEFFNSHRPKHSLKAAESIGLREWSLVIDCLQGSFSLPILEPKNQISYHFEGED